MKAVSPTPINAILVSSDTQTVDFKKLGVRRVSVGAIRGGRPTGCMGTLSNRSGTVSGGT